MTPCRCNRSVAVLGGLFASLAACVFLAGDACLDRGGIVSGTAWVCELAAGSSASLWQLLSPPGAALAVLVVGLPVYFVVDFLGRRFIVACGLPAD